MLHSVQVHIIAVGKTIKTLKQKINTKLTNLTQKTEIKKNENEKKTQKYYTKISSSLSPHT